MTKQLSIAAALVLAVACKTDNAPTAKPADTPAAQSAKIDVKKQAVRPELPADGTPGAVAEGSPTDNPYGTEDGLPASYPVVPNTIVPEVRNPDLPDPDELSGRNVWRKRRKLDTNRDGVVDDDERDAAIFSRLTATHARLDANEDGVVSAQELSSAPGRMRFSNAAALDTDRNGDISPDELAAGFKARRERRAAGLEPPEPPPPPLPPPLPIDQQPVLPPPQ
jgi:hypothetical protein